jgi:hypothetical protein
MTTNNTITPEGVQVEVGQVWFDQDKRCNGRRIVITRVDSLNGFAYYDRPKRRVRIDRLRLSFWSQTNDH